MTTFKKENIKYTFYLKSPTICIVSSNKELSFGLLKTIRSDLEDLHKTKVEFIKPLGLQITNEYEYEFKLDLNNKKEADVYYVDFKNKKVINL